MYEYFQATPVLKIKDFYLHRLDVPCYAQHRALGMICLTVFQK